MEKLEKKKEEIKDNEILKNLVDEIEKLRILDSNKELRKFQFPEDIIRIIGEYEMKNPENLSASEQQKILIENEEKSKKAILTTLQIHFSKEMQKFFRDPLNNSKAIIKIKKKYTKNGNVNSFTPFEIEVKHGKFENTFKNKFYLFQDCFDNYEFFVFEIIFKNKNPKDYSSRELLKQLLKLDILKLSRTINSVRSENQVIYKIFIQKYPIIN